MRSKMMDIKKIKQQRHVTQVLTVHDDMQEQLYYCIDKMFYNENVLKEQKQQKYIELGKIYWLFSRINQKLDEVCELFLSMTQKSEMKQTLLWDKIKRNIAEDKVAYPQQYIERLHYQLFTPSVEAIDINNKLEIHQKIKFRQTLRQLYKWLHGRNNYVDIKELVDERERKLQANAKLHEQVISRVNTLYEQQ